MRVRNGLGALARHPPRPAVLVEQHHGLGRDGHAEEVEAHCTARRRRRPPPPGPRGTCNINSSWTGHHNRSPWPNSRAKRSQASTSSSRAADWTTELMFLYACRAASTRRLPGGVPGRRLSGLDVETTYMDDRGQFGPDFRVRLVQFATADTADTAWVLTVDDEAQQSA